MPSALPAHVDQPQVVERFARDAVMKIPRRFANRFPGTTMAAAAMAVLFQGGVAQGATWKTTPSNANWNDSANWDTLPVSGSALVFGTSSITTHNNNLAADLSIAGITFNSNASAHTLAGNRITLTGNVTVGTGIVSEAINFDMIMNNVDRTFTVNSGTLTLGGAITGTGANNARFIKNGNGVMVLTNTGNSFGNRVQSNGGGILRSGANNVLPDNAALLVGNGSVGGISNVLLDLAGYNDTVVGDGNRAIFWMAGGAGGTSTIDTGGGTLTFSGTQSSGIIGHDSASAQAKLIKGNLNLGAATRTLFTSGGAGTMVISANISGNAGNIGITQSGGTTMLSGNNTYTGATTISGGKIIARSASALGTGSLANVTANGNLIYSAATDTALNIGGTLSLGNIGTSIGNGAASAQINVAGNASGTIGTVNIYGVNGVSHYAGLATLIHGAGGSTLLGTPTLGFVYNNTDFTVASGSAAFTRTSTDLQVTTASATALSGNVNWKGGLAGATGVWAASNGSTQSNWQVTDGVNQPLAPGSTADVVFSTATSPGTMVGMTLGTDMTVRSLTINNTTTAFGLLHDGYALTIAPAGSSTGITIAASVQASTINADIVLGAAQTWTNNSANALTVNSIISGTGSLTKAGTGKVTLNGRNTYSGDTKVTGGTLDIGLDAALQNSALDTSGAGVVTITNYTMPTFGGLKGSTNLASVITTGYSNVVGLTLNPGTGVTNSYSGNITNGAANMTLTKTGAGTQVLGGTNTYSGSTIIKAGTLVVNGSLGAASTVTVGGAGTSGTPTLGGSGTINGSVTIAAAGSGAAGTLSPGASIGTLTFANTLGLNGSALMEIDGNAGAGLAGGHDFANLTGADAAGTLTYGGALILDMGTIFASATYSWDLFDFASETGTFASITLADQYSGILLDGDSNGVWDLVSGNNTWSFTESTGVLGLTVVPEPSAALLGSLGMLILVFRRRSPQDGEAR